MRTRAGHLTSRVVLLSAFGGCVTEEPPGESTTCLPGFFAEPGEHLEVAFVDGVGFDNAGCDVDATSWDTENDADDRWHLFWNSGTIKPSPIDAYSFEFWSLVDSGQPGTYSLDPM